MEKSYESRLVGYLVNRLREKEEEKQIGKTVVQKMIYLMSMESDMDFDYSMYHYGPFSKHTAGALDLAKKYGFVKMEWVPEKGYFIEPLEKFSEEALDEESKDSIDRVVDRYGKYSAIELSIIATGVYVKTNFDYGDGEELVETVSSLKSDHDKDWIREILEEEGVIDN